MSSAETARLLPQLQKASLIELDIFGAGGAVDVLDDVAVAIRLALVGLHEQIVALLDPNLRGFRPRLAFLVNLDARADAVRIVGIDELDIGVVEIVIGANGGHLDPLNEA